MATCLRCLRWVVCLYFLLAPSPDLANGFLTVSVGRFRNAVVSTTTTAVDMCICVNCARVIDCSAYHFVETKHEQPHMTDNPTFTPRDGSPTIHVNVRTTRATDGGENVFARMRLEHEQETARAVAVAAAAQVNNTPNEAPINTQLHGETVYDLAPVTTYEYDVVKCADFVHDQGCWVRYMPEAIRLANPNFVPT
jgi:Hypothetical chloroplast protein Ycf34